MRARVSARGLRAKQPRSLQPTHVIRLLVAAIITDDEMATWPSRLNQPVIHDAMRPCLPPILAAQLRERGGMISAQGGCHSGPVVVSRTNRGPRWSGTRSRAPPCRRRRSRRSLRQGMGSPVSAEEGLAVASCVKATHCTKRESSPRWPSQARPSTMRWRMSR